MGVLLYKLSGRPTGREIGRGLGLLFGTCGYFNRKGIPIDVAIRWGGAELPEKDSERTLNKSGAIRAASSKIETFRRLADADIPIPRFTLRSAEASEWETTVLGRTSQGFQGRGISVYQAGDALGTHELYTEYIPNEREYRLHVVNGVVIGVQRKYLERPDQQRSPYIKNHSNGFVFKTPERGLNTSRGDAAIGAVNALDLTFGAVDLVIDEEGKEYVLEVNTAPALSPRRVQQYVQALQPLLAT